MQFRFNEHPKFEGAHAFLSPSQGSWINYSRDKLIEVYENKRAIEEGTELHDLARRLIEKRIKPQKTKQTFNMYVNDAIGYRMTPEVSLVYSDFCFGTADSIMYDPKNHFLRIHDLKTGQTKASMRQLEIYAALFCLEYKINPKDISMELRIYQYNDVEIEIPDYEQIQEYCNRIVELDKELTKYELEVYS